MSGDGYFGRPRREMRAFIPAGVATLLDVGCGAGAFGAGLKRARPDLEVWGIEFSPEAAARAGEALDRVFTGDARKVAPTLPAGGGHEKADPSP